MQGHWTSGHICEMALQRSRRCDNNYVSSMRYQSNDFLQGVRSLPLPSPVVGPETESACVVEHYVEQ